MAKTGSLLIMLGGWDCRLVHIENPVSMPLFDRGSIHQSLVCHTRLAQGVELTRRALYCTYIVDGESRSRAQ